MQQLNAKVTKLSSAQTVKVEVVRRWTHPKYHKIISKRKGYLVHCDIKVAEGDRVVLQPIKPVSRMKKWKIVKVL
jgi:small subunit ribosomal protein S17